MRIFKNSRKNIQWNKWIEKDREEVIRQEIEKLAPPDVIGSRKEEELEEYSEESIEAPFTPEEFKRVIEMVRRNTAPGRDGIEYRMLKSMPTIMEESLLEIFNAVWTTDEFPKDWRKYQVTFIDKVGKEKVRPIALSSCVSKLMERMVNERLV